VADHLIGGLHCADVTDLAAGFVLGALEPAEADAVRIHLASCPEAHAEVAALGSVAPALFETVEIVEPSAGLRDRILAAAGADQRRSADTQVVSDARPDARPVEPPLAIDRQRPLGARERTRGGGLFGRAMWTPVAIAAALAVVALGAWNIVLQAQVSDLTAYRTGVVEVLNQAARPGSQLAVLAPSDGSPGPSGLAAVAADGSVAMVLRDLKPTTGSQVYEAWLLGVDGKPIPIGGFQVGGSGTAAFVAHGTAAPGITVALTLEPGAGAKTPTQPIIAVGKARSQAS
jgi:anti-sigma-K factor RskA